MDRIVIERLILVDVGQKLVVFAGAHRHDAVEVLENVPMWGQEMAWAERARVAPDVHGPHARSEKGCHFDEIDVPFALLREQMSCRTTGKSPTDDQRLLCHSSDPHLASGSSIYIVGLSLSSTFSELPKLISGGAGETFLTKAIHARPDLRHVRNWDGNLDGGYALAPAI